MTDMDTISITKYILQKTFDNNSVNIVKITIRIAITLTVFVFLNKEYSI